MKLKKLIKEAAEIAEPFRVTKGKKFRLKDYDPADTGGLKDKEKALKTLQQGVELLSHFQEKLYAPSFSGHGCCWKRWRHQARHVRNQSTGLQRDAVQGSFVGRTEPRLPVARSQSHSGTRQNRPFQQVVLRRGPSRTRASKHPGRAATAQGIGRKRCLEEALRRHQLFREISFGQRRDRAEVLPSSVERRTKEALFGTAGDAGEELEIFTGGC